MSLKPGDEWRAEGHKGTVISLAKGAGYWLDDSGCRTVDRGDALVIGPNHRGTLRVSQLFNATFSVLTLQPGAASPPASVSDHVEGLIRRFPASVNHFSAASPNAVRLGRIMSGSEPASRRRTAMVRVIQWLADCVDPSGALRSEMPAQLMRARAGRRLSDWLAGIPRAELATMTVEEMARRFGCSSRHLGRMFQREFGMSVRQRQIAWRIEIARELFRDDRLLVQEVAHACGYRNLGLFNAAFKRSTGMTPGQWRRRSAVEGQVVLQERSTSRAGSGFAHNSAIALETGQTDGAIHG